MSGSFVCILCFIPGNELPRAGWLDRIHADKIIHVILYAAWMFNWLAGTESATLKKAGKIAMILALAGAGVEGIQEVWIPLRSAEWADWFADLGGILAGFWFFRSLAFNA